MRDVHRSRRGTGTVRPLARSLVTVVLALTFAGIILGCDEGPARTTSSNGVHTDPSDGLISSDTHGWWRSGSEGAALSPDGEYLALSVARRPVNELHVVHLPTGTGWRLIHNDPGELLAQPTFSSDGERIAFVVSRPFYTNGDGRIWIGDFRTGAGAFLEDDGQRTYRHPTFSLDGTVLHYFAAPVHMIREDLDRSKVGSTYHGDWSLYRYDLESGIETSTTNEDFRIVCGVKIEPQQGSLLYCAHQSPLDPAAQETRDSRLDARTAWYLVDGELSNLEARTLGRAFKEFETPAFVGFIDSGALVERRAGPDPTYPDAGSASPVLHYANEQRSFEQAPYPGPEEFVVSPSSPKIIGIQRATMRSRMIGEITDEYTVYIWTSTESPISEIIKLHEVNFDLAVYLCLNHERCNQIEDLEKDNGTRTIYWKSPRCAPGRSP